MARIHHHLEGNAVASVRHLRRIVELMVEPVVLFRIPWIGAGRHKIDPALVRQRVFVDCLGIDGPAIERRAVVGEDNVAPPLDGILRGAWRVFADLPRPGIGLGDPDDRLASGRDGDGFDIRGGNVVLALVARQETGLVGIHEIAGDLACAADVVVVVGIVDPLRKA